MTSINVYPNPSNTGEFNLSLPMNSSALEVNLYNDLGQKIKIKNILSSNNQWRYRTEHALSTGVYHIVIIPADGNTVVKKWVVNN